MISISIIAKTITTGILALAATAIVNAQMFVGGAEGTEAPASYASKIAASEKCLFVIF